MFDIKKLLEIPPFNLEKNKKNEILENAFNSLTSYHYNNCIEYKHILSSLHYSEDKTYTIEEILIFQLDYLKNLNY